MRFELSQQVGKALWWGRGETDEPRQHRHRDIYEDYQGPS